MKSLTCRKIPWDIRLKASQPFSPCTKSMKRTEEGAERIEDSTRMIESGMISRSANLRYTNNFPFSVQSAPVYMHQSTLHLHSYPTNSPEKYDGVMSIKPISSSNGSRHCGCRHNDIRPTAEESIRNLRWNPWAITPHVKTGGCENYTGMDDRFGQISISFTFVLWRPPFLTECQKW